MDERDTQERRREGEGEERASGGSLLYERPKPAHNNFKARGKHKRGRECVCVSARNKENGEMLLMKLSKRGRRSERQNKEEKQRGVAKGCNKSYVATRQGRTSLTPPLRSPHLANLRTTCLGFSFFGLS